MEQTHVTSQGMRRILSLVVCCLLAWTMALPVPAALAQEGQVSADAHEATQTDAKADAQAATQTDAQSDAKADAKSDAKDPEQELAMSAQDDAIPDATPAAEPTTVADTVAQMTLDEKISQMIVVAARQWDATDVTELNDALAAALQRHQYGGIILFAGNVQGTDQAAQLVASLQNNNMGIANVTKHVPYFTAVDEEGGVVMRFATGTRMNGSMAVGATGQDALLNARETGRVLGEECAALGFNLDFAPSIDVNSNPTNPVIGTRSFSDDPQTVGPLGAAFAEGLAQSNVIATLKHFPGHGDTSTDTHTSGATILKTLEDLEACELVPFSANAGSADMVMTAHISLPNYDDPVEFADGSTGYYPATMSRKVITDLLRGQLGYEGVVVTDALEMDAVAKAKLVPGEEKSAEYSANVAEKVINAGVDILLIPADLVNDDAAAFYDEYIQRIADKVEAGTISRERIDQSVTRILELKQKYQIFDAARTDVPAFAANPEADAIVGSEEHHQIEAQIASEAVTLVKNDAQALPIAGRGSKVVLIGRLANDCKTLRYAIDGLKESGAVDQDALVCDLSCGSTTGSQDATTRITMDYYYDASTSELHFTDELSAAIAQADTVVCCTASYGAAPLASTSPLYQGVMRAMEETHRAGGKFVLLANNLPYDVARYQGADALMLGYMAAGLNVDPAEGKVAYNANVIAAIQIMFGASQPKGTLPVDIPVVTENEDGTITYTDEVLYARGHGLGYDWQESDIPVGYDAYCQDLAWNAPSGSNGTTAGTTGMSLRLEAMRVHALEEGNILYRSHVQDEGWEEVWSMSSDEGVSGSMEQSRRIEAIQMDRDETLAQNGYHVWYRVHSQNYGWLGWAKDGEVAGTTGQGLRAEAYEMVVLADDKVPAGYDSSVPAYVGNAVGNAHLRDIGWQGNRPAGLLGTTGESRRLEALRLSFGGQAWDGGITYQSHVQDLGWEDAWATDGAMSGTTGQSKRVEAVRIQLTGELADHYSVWYRVHSEDFGWLGWAHDGEDAGTVGQSKRAEAIDLQILPEGIQPSYGEVGNACVAA